MTIRLLLPTDNRIEIRNIYEQSWKYAYKDIIPESFFESIPSGQWASNLDQDGMHTLVMVEEDKLIGTSSYCKARTSENWTSEDEYSVGNPAMADLPAETPFKNTEDADSSDAGESVSIYLLPEYIGKGYGRQLLDAVVNELVKIGYHNIVLWVLEENVRARRFYEKAGFTLTGKIQDINIGGKELREVQYSRLVEDTHKKEPSEETKLLYPSLAMNESLQRTLDSFNNMQNRLTKSVMSSMMPQQQLLDSIVDAMNAPVKAMQASIASSTISLINDSIQAHYNNMLETVMGSLHSFMETSRLTLFNSVKNIIASYNNSIWQAIQTPIQQMIQSIDYSPFYELLGSFADFDFTGYKDPLHEIIAFELYEAKWFPHAMLFADSTLLFEIIDILDSTKTKKIRIRKLNGLIINYYNKTKIETMKKAWRRPDIPGYKFRIMHQAVQAYHRKEYALTVVVLSTLWEGIIYDKVHDNGGKKGKQTKENFNKLTNETDFYEIIQSFFEEYIMYDCRSVEDVKEDVPGRNSSAHSWFSRYPSRKAALNAILFTDFLLSL